MTRIIKYEVTAVIEDDGTLIDPTDAMDVDIKIASGQGVELKDMKVERLD